MTGQPGRVEAVQAEPDLQALVGGEVLGVGAEMAALAAYFEIGIKIGDNTTWLTLEDEIDPGRMPEGAAGLVIDHQIGSEHADPLEITGTVAATLGSQQLRRQSLQRSALRSRRIGPESQFDATLGTANQTHLGTEKVKPRGRHLTLQQGGTTEAHG